MTHLPEHEPTEAEIQKTAYSLYLKSGCILGHELDHWFAAKELLLHQHGRDGRHVHRSLSPPASARATPAIPNR